MRISDDLDEAKNIQNNLFLRIALIGLSVHGFSHFM